MGGILFCIFVKIKEMNIDKIEVLQFIRINSVPKPHIMKENKFRMKLRSNSR